MARNTTTNGNELWSVYQFFNRFPNEKTAREHIERMRWNDEKFCPHCGVVGRVSEVKNENPMPYRCKDCRKFFSVRTGTIFEKAKLPLHKCLLAIYLLTTAKKGIPSRQLAKELGCTQKTAWYLGHRIRRTMEQGYDMLNGEVEVDETYIGGKEKNKHASKKIHEGRGPVGKQPVLGLVERGGEVKAFQIQGTDRASLHSSIKANVQLGSSIYTDDLPAYKNLNGYDHKSVKHSLKEYVNDMAHTNGIESFWALLKRGYIGVYHWMSEKHIQRYINEFATRHNRRDLGTLSHINLCVRGMFGKRLSYEELIK